MKTSMQMCVAAVSANNLNAPPQLNEWTKVVHSDPGVLVSNTKEQAAGPGSSVGESQARDAAPQKPHSKRFSKKKVKKMKLCAHKYYPADDWKNCPERCWLCTR